LVGIDAVVSIIGKCSILNMFGLKMPIHAHKQRFLRDFTPKWGAAVFTQQTDPIH